MKYTELDRLVAMAYIGDTTEVVGKAHYLALLDKAKRLEAVVDSVRCFVAGHRVQIEERNRGGMKVVRAVRPLMAMSTIIELERLLQEADND